MSSSRIYFGLLSRTMRRVEFKLCRVQIVSSSNCVEFKSRDRVEITRGHNRSEAILFGVRTLANYRT